MIKQPVLHIYGLIQVCSNSSANALEIPQSCVSSSDDGDGILGLWRSTPCLLMPWLLKSPEHQQACHWLCRTDMYCCSKVNFIYSRQTISKIWFKMWLYLLYFLKQFSMLRSKTTLYLPCWQSTLVHRGRRSRPSSPRLLAYPHCLVTIWKVRNLTRWPIGDVAVILKV